MCPQPSGCQYFGPEGRWTQTQPRNEASHRTQLAPYSHTTHTYVPACTHTHTHTHTVLTYTNTQYYLLHPVSYVECNMRGHSETHKRTRTGEPWLRRKQLAGVSASCFLSNTSKLSTSLPLLEYDSHDSRSIVANT